MQEWCCVDDMSPERMIVGLSPGWVRCIHQHRSPQPGSVWVPFANEVVVKALHQWLGGNPAWKLLVPCTSSSKRPKFWLHVGMVYGWESSVSAVQSVKPGPHEQQCRSNIVEATGNFVACCLDNVAAFGDNFEATLPNFQVWGSCPTRLPRSQPNVAWKSKPKMYCITHYTLRDSQTLIWLVS